MVQSRSIVSLDKLILNYSPERVETKRKINKESEVGTWNSAMHSSFTSWRLAAPCGMSSVA